MLASGLLLGGCRSPPAVPDAPLGLFKLAEVVAQQSAPQADADPGLVSPVAFATEPVLASETYNDETRQVVKTSLEGWTWTGVVPANARLELGAQLVPAHWDLAEYLEVEVVAWRGDAAARPATDKIAAWPATPTDGSRVALPAPGSALQLAVVRASGKRRMRHWMGASVDLSALAGERVTLAVRGQAPGIGAEEPATVVFGPAGLSAAGPAAPPNVLFILVDTLRADHLGAYGYDRPTSPQIDRWLAQGGTLFENAYAQAPWTLPSVISLFAGRYPNELLGDDPATYALPPGQVVLPELFAARGYQTAGFLANTTMHAGNGFARGWQTVYLPPGGIQAIQLHAEEVAHRATSWLATHQSSPFFAYLHFVDPHDPYVNPDLIDGRSDFYPDYSGGLTGLHVHGVYNGRHPLTDPASDVAHLTALYDSEVLYVDRFIGEVLASLRPEVLARTVVVLTSDHGEELYDHGGWKHGQTLYEEQIHVPLLVRWDGRVAAGRRVSEAVSLVDVLPTLAELTGAPLDAQWDGVSLAPVLLNGAVPARRPVYAQHLSVGPLRAATLLDGKKLIRYDREAPYDPGEDKLRAYLAALDQRRLEPTELYDLTTDRRERNNLAGAEPELAMRLAGLIDRRLDAGVPGLRVTVAGYADAGSPQALRVSGTLRCAGASLSVRPWFLRRGDRLELNGDQLHFDWQTGPLGIGAILSGDFAGCELTTLAVRRCQAGSDISCNADAPSLPVSIVGPRGPLRSGLLWQRDELAGDRPVEPAGGGVLIWEPTTRGAPAGEHNDETLARLRALGYVGDAP